MRILIGAALFAAALPLHAQPAAQAAVQGSKSGPVTTENYYRIKWGSAGELKRLYERNHAPILRELQKQGFITEIEVEEPFTHLAGAPRWDLRVTLTFADAAAAVVVGGAFDKASAAVVDRLYPDKAKFDAEEARRFSLLEEHWDVIVTPVGD